MSPDEQIIGVLEIIQYHRAVNPDDEAFMVTQQELMPYSSHDAILNKLETEYEAISVQRRPNEHNMGDADIDLAEEEVGSTVIRDYMSYSILVTPKFDTVFDELYSRAELTKNASSTVMTALQPESYDKRIGVLSLSQNHRVAIAKRGKAKKSTNLKYFECFVLEKLFGSKTSLNDGVSFHSLLGSHRDKPLTKADIKKVRNARTAINNKVTEANGPEKLIIIQGERVYINPMYLL